MAEPLIPARPARTADGTLYSEAYGDVYHAAAGGPGQARHVFLAGNGLPERWRGRPRFVILETGFGTGLNFLATWAAWRADPQAPERLHYLAVEKHPFPAADLAAIHAAWPELAEPAARLRAAWPTLVPGYHRLELEGGRLSLTLMFGDAESCLKRLRARVDAFFLDGFAPNRNPAMWSEPVLRRLGRLAAPDATLATWSVAGPVREALSRAGFALEKRPGYAGKREMLTGRPEAGHAPDLSPHPAAGDRHALIIGAGLAGCATARSLARRGWQVTLLERHGAPAREASGNLAGIVRPLLSLDDNIASRFTRAAFLHALRTWRELEAEGRGPRWEACGVLQIARDAAHADHQRDLVEAHAYPSGYVSFLTREEAAERVGWPLAQGGWLFPGGGWAHPPGVCAANLAAGGDGVSRRFGADVDRLERRDGLWHALDPAGRELAQAPVAILAGGAQTGQLAQAAGLPLRRVRGQVSHLPAGGLPPLRLALCRDGYATPAPDGLVCAGASYNFDAEAVPRPEDHEGNLARLELILPGSTARLEAGGLDGRVGFRAVAPDRLPLIGPLPGDPATLAGEVPTLSTLPRREGLHALLGLASRGLVWAQLAAELLAGQLEGEPLPLESDLVDALDPARFVLRRLRRGRA